MLTRSIERFGSKLAIDLGTANTLISLPGHGILLNEPSIVALATEKNKARIIAIGEEARDMVGQTPASVQIIRPLKDGVISDYEAAEEMIKYLIRRAFARRNLIKPNVLLCVPIGATDVDRRTIRQAAWAGGAGKVHILDEPVAAAIGAGCRVLEQQGSMVVDIGGGTTDIAVLSLGRVIASKSLRIAGDAMDASIVRFVQKNFRFLISNACAEELKIEVGSARPDRNAEEIEIYIRGTEAGLKGTREISMNPYQIAEGLQNAIEEIAEAIVEVVNNLPPDIAADINREGLVLTGGGACLQQIDEILEEKTGLSCRRADNPMECVIQGAGTVVADLERYRAFLHRF